MPWDENDYPDSMKNLPKTTRKKAIDIANAMVDDGYDEGRAIPIAIEQAKEWQENASKEEINHYKKHGDPEKRSSDHTPSNPERLDETEHVISHDDGWAVKSSGAERVTKVFTKKEEAVARAKEIAKNKGTGIIIFRADGTVQEEHSYQSE